MRIPRIVVATSLGCAVATAACSLLVSTDDLSGGAGGSTPDGALGETGSNGDSSNDPDGPSGGDASKSDAGGDASSDGSTTGCTSPAIFCDDFERGALLGAWTKTLGSNGGSASILSGEANRVMSVAVTGENSNANAGVERSFDLTPSSRYAIEGRITIPALPSSGGIHLQHFAFVTSEAVHQFAFLYVAPDGIHVSELMCSGTPPCAYKQSAVIAVGLGAPHAVRLEIEFGSPTNRARLFVDGTKKYDEAALAGIAAAARTVIVTAGIPYTDAPHSAFTAQIDDVRLEVQ